MSADLVTEILTDMFFTAMIILLPVLLSSLSIGVFLAIFQAATSISEMTLTFVPKIIITAIVLILTLPFIVDKLSAMAIKYFNLYNTLMQ